VYKEHRRKYFDSSLRKWNQEILSDNDDASSEFTVAHCVNGILVVIISLDRANGDVYSDEDISGAEHILIEHVLPVDNEIQQNAVDHGVRQNAVNGM